MESREGGQSPKVSFCDDDRAKIEAYVHISKFTPGDKVYFRVPGTGTLEGPYLIASVPSAGRYTLSFEDGRQAKDGAEVEEKDLEEA